MNTEKPKTTRAPRRGATAICELLRYMRWLDNVGSKGYKTLDSSASSAVFFLEQRAKCQKTPDKSLAAGVVVVSLQTGLITEDMWENQLRYCYLVKEEWDAAIDTLFAQLFGRVPDRSNDYMLNLDALDVWDRVKLPYTEEQFKFLEKVYKDKKKKSYNDLTYDEKQRYYYQPLSFDEIEKPASKPAEDKDDSSLDSLTDSLALIFYLRATPDRQEQMRKKWKQKGYRKLLEAVGYDEEDEQEEVINPEQVAHADQDRIDTVAASLLAELSL